MRLDRKARPLFIVSLLVEIAGIAFIAAWAMRRDQWLLVTGIALAFVGAAFQFLALAMGRRGDASAPRDT